MPRHEPERTCLLTRRTGGQHDFLRFVLSPDGAIVVDLRNRLPGRGVWLTPTAEAVADASRRKLFGRGFKTEIRAPATLADDVDAAMRRDLQGSLSLAVKAGAATAGFAKVEAAIGSGTVAAVIHALEAAPDGRRKLVAALRRQAAGAISSIPVFDDLPGDDLAVAFGRDNVIHAALLAGAGSEGCVMRWRRLRRYRGLSNAVFGDDAGPQRDIDNTDGAAPPDGRIDTV